MSSEPKTDWQQKLKEIEVEVTEASPISQKTTANVISTVNVWFANLHPIAKIIVALFAISVFFSLLKTVFSLLQLMFSVAILGIIGYVVYKFLLQPSKNNNSEL